MNILFISFSSFYSTYSSSFRNRSFILSLLSHGHHIYVLTYPPCDVDIQLDINFSVPNLHLIHFSTDSSHSSPISSSSSHSLLKKILRFFHHKLFLFEFSSPRLWSSSLLTRLLPRDIDLLISSSDPRMSHLLAKKILSLYNYNIPWFQYWGDPFSNNISRRHIYPEFVVHYFEFNILKCADRIFYTSPFSLDIQQKQYKSLASRMFFLPTVSQDKYISTDDLFVSPIVVGYHGTYSPHIRDLFPLIQSFRVMKSFRLQIIGPKVSLGYSSPSNVQFIDTTNDLDHFLSLTSILVVVLNRDGAQIPGKIYHLAGYNRPILIVLDGPFSSDFLSAFKGFNRYYFCRNSVDDIVKCINKITTDRVLTYLNPFSKSIVTKDFFG